ncbi:phosphatidylglycerophosphatase A [Candidatus Pelagibacter sp.]|jgi:phosphatidylglycerophosphatase A|nr:phosphatidylglycerophosphatase A [Candidatus Pelagibacter sp.]
MKKINILISTFFGYGYISKIPGTVTSFVTTVFIYIAYEYLGYADLKFSVIFFTLLFFYSFYAVKDSESEFKNKDPRQIVIDEVLGQAMPLILLLYLNQTNQLSLQIEIYYVLSFLFFRFFDIIKPFPVSYFDKNFKNYFGIIMDDIMAGLYSMLLIYLISLKF